ncbi:hypothetical protein R1sor_017970 [Riccia sorocarpa]|uniref:DDE Tnp4 domain-containing protein n=1 Tax=Riccia sorocarpa TaxID=122646 RepID=A0ABD3I8G0_9MARC
MVNYTNMMMTALDSCMGNEIAWPDRQKRARTVAHFGSLGFLGCVGLEDGTFVKLSQRPRDDGETYYDRKSNYSLNVQAICEEHKYVILIFAGMPAATFHCNSSSAHTKQLEAIWTRCLSIPAFAHARVGKKHYIGILKARWHSLREIRTQLRNARENMYVIRWIRCCVILHNFLIWRKDEWSKDDYPIELDGDDDLRPPPLGVREHNKRGIQHRQEVPDLCLEINRRSGGPLCR